MLRKRQHSALQVVLLLILSCYGFAEPCPIEHANTEEAIAFLKAARTDSRVKGACITTAIHKLYQVRSKDAINVLTMYLDYKQSSEGVMTGSNMEPYPAVAELFGIGKPALPALVQVVSRSTSTQTVRDNAIKAIMLIHRDDPRSGIKFILDEAAKSKSGDVLAQREMEKRRSPLV
jgi:hypothetical protein